MSHGDSLHASGDMLDDDDRTGLDASPILAPEEPTTNEADVGTALAAEVVTETSQERIWRKHNVLLRDLLTSLDAVIYIELAAIYYLEYVEVLFQGVGHL